MKGKSSNRIIAIVLLLAFGAWIAVTVLPGTKTEVGKTTTTKENTGIVEPQFEKEGHLAFVSAEMGDTIKEIEIELAERADEIMYGMMYRKSMDENTGMLFLMEQEKRQSFYMKNTFVSLDIIYINSNMQVVSIVKNAEPLNEKSLPSEEPASLVLEVKGGFSDKYGITKGTKITWERAS